MSVVLHDSDFLNNSWRFSQFMEIGEVFLIPKHTQTHTHLLISEHQMEEVSLLVVDVKTHRSMGGNVYSSVCVCVCARLGC